MSENWSLYCAECETGPDPDYYVGINHGEMVLRDMVRFGRALLAVPGEAETNVSLQLWSWPVPLDFLREHRSHRLVIVSEYGDTEAVGAPVPTLLGVP
jgi:hypothetical protein